MNLIRIFGLTLILIPRVCLAMYSASPPNDVQIASFSYMNEEGVEAKISNVISRNKALILVPAYFNCNSTCPLLAENLKKSILASKDSGLLNVLFLSFNSDDSKTTMSMFREHHKLPSNWAMGVIKNRSSAKDFLAQFQYTFQKTENGFDHPNAAYVFSPDSLIWTGSLFGVENTISEVESAYQSAVLANQAGVGATFLRFIGKREYIILFGIFGTIIPLFYVFWFFARRKRYIEVGSHG